MGRRAPSVLVVLLLWLVGFGRSDFASDRNECTNDLVGLATCLPFVEGQAKTPTTVCCSGLKQVLQKSAKCLCVLVRDRDDPNLGFTINGTSALMLPSTYKSPVKAIKCIASWCPWTTSTRPAWKGLFISGICFKFVLASNICTWLCRYIQRLVFEKHGLP